MNFPNDQGHDLGARLAGLSEWGNGRPELWRAALRRVEAAPAPARGMDALGAALSRPLSSRFTAWVGIAAVVLLVVGLMLPNLGRTRSSARRVAAPSVAAGPAPAAAPAPEGFSVSHDVPGRQLSPAAPSTGAPQPASPPSTPRHIVRKATVELRAADVRAVFMKAAMIPSQARGEYVEDSSLTGDDEDASATLTLRVGADRLADVLRELRELGEVVAEQVRGEDVTSQIVDLDARLRNERRFEEELLALLDTRQDASLEDVLAVRDRLAAVRGQIETLEAQRQHLGRLVSLATVLVLVRTPDGIGRGAGVSLGEHFTETVADAWRRGLEALVGTVGWLVTVLIGGLVWWVVLGVAAWVVVRRMRRVAELRGAP